MPDNDTRFSWEKTQAALVLSTRILLSNLDYSPIPGRFRQMLAARRLFGAQREIDRHPNHYNMWLLNTSACLDDFLAVASYDEKRACTRAMHGDPDNAEIRDRYFSHLMHTQLAEFKTHNNGAHLDDKLTRAESESVRLQEQSAKLADKVMRLTFGKHADIKHRSSENGR